MLKTIKYYNFMLSQMIWKYDTLLECCEDTVNKIEEDEAFCEFEDLLMEIWFSERGFTKKDYDYSVSCGYEDRWYCEEWREKQ